MIFNQPPALDSRLSGSRPRPTASRPRPRPRLWHLRKITKRYYVQCTLYITII